MSKFYFYGTVIYPVKDPNDIPKGMLGLHCVEGESEEELKLKYKTEHEKQNLYLIDMFGYESKAEFKWYGELK